MSDSKPDAAPPSEREPEPEPKTAAEPEAKAETREPKPEPKTKTAPTATKPAAKAGDKAQKSKTEEDSDDEEADAPEDDKPMSFWDHLDELRKRITRCLLALLIGMCVTWYYKEKFLDIITKPFKDAWVEEGIPGNASLHFAAPGDSFLAFFNLAIIGGVAIAAPVIFYQLWSFIAPGLYAREKKYVIPFVLMSSILFVGGGWFGYLAAFPITFGYFLSLAGNVGENITIVPTVMMADYISFVMKMTVAFGLIFQVPILFTFLALTGVVNHKKMIRWARYYVFIAFLASAVLTPPDATSMLVMAVPAVGLYFASIGLVYIFQRKSSLLAEEEREKEEAEKLAKKELEEKEKAEKARKASKPKAKA